MPTIQEQIDCLGANGGKVCLPPGDFRNEGQIILRPNVMLIGSGAATIIAGVRPYDFNARQYWNSLQDLHVVGTPNCNYIGIDFRRVSCSSVKNVFVTGFQTGVLLAYAAYFNLLENVFTDCAVDGIELYDGANQNTILNCKPSAPIAIQIISTNGTTIIGGSGEGATPGNFIKQSGGSAGTAVRGFRGESAGWGPVWCNVDSLSGNF